MPTEDAQIDAAALRRAFVLRRVHSLSGVVPIGAFLVEHLWTNSTALAGKASFDRAVDGIQALPALPLVETLFIFAPLVFHATYGLAIARQGSANVNAYPTGRNWSYLMQRVSGVVTLLFIVGHLYEYRVQKAFFGMPAGAFYDTLAAHLSSTYAGIPWIALGYLLGLLSTCFHLANGLGTFCITWGLTSSKAARKRASWAFAGLGAFLFFLGTNTVMYFATGSALFVQEAKTSKVPCSSSSSSLPLPPSPQN